MLIVPAYDSWNVIFPDTVKHERETVLSPHVQRKVTWQCNYAVFIVQVWSTLLTYLIAYLENYCLGIHVQGCSGFWCLIFLLPTFMKNTWTAYSVLIALCFLAHVFRWLGIGRIHVYCNSNIMVKLFKLYWAIHDVQS